MRIKISTRSVCQPYPIPMPDRRVRVSRLHGWNWFLVLEQLQVLMVGLSLLLKPALECPVFSERYSYQWQLPANQLAQSAVVGPMSSRANPRAAQLLSRHGSSNQFASKSSNFMPSDFSASWAPKSAYESQFKVDMSFKQEPRFDWKPGSGTPRPQSSLLDIQDGFSKSESRKMFRRQFPENLPDLRENIVLGRKHEFDSMNAQVLRGTTLVEVA